MTFCLQFIGLAGLVLASLPSLGQVDNYRLLPTGDTVRGFVNDRSGRCNSLECYFRGCRTLCKYSTICTTSPRLAGPLHGVGRNFAWCETLLLL